MEPDSYYEYRVAFKRWGLRPLSYGGRAYRRINAATEEQARGFVADEVRDGREAWVERREVSPWKRIK